MEKKHFFKGLSLLIILNLLIKPVWIFGIDRQVQNMVGHQQYGTYFALLNLSIVLLFIADAGLGNMLSQRIAAKLAVSSNQLLQLKIIQLLLYAIACGAVGWLSQITNWEIFLYIICIQLMASLFLFLRSLLTAHQLFRQDAVFSVVDKGLMIILCGVFIYGWSQPITLTAFLQLQLLSSCLATSIFFLFIFKRRLVEEERKESLIVIAKWLAPFAAIILLMGIHYRIDGFLLERLHPAGALQTGIYAMAYRLLEAGNMIGYLAASFLVSFIARNKNDKQLVETVILRSQQVLLSVAIATACFALVFAPWIQQFLYHSSDAYNSKVIQLSLAVLPAYYLVHIYGSALTAISNFKAFLTILAISVVINISLNIWLIPLYGATGCCIAALASQYFCGVACYFTVTNRLSFSHSTKSWLAYGTLAAALLLIFFLLRMAIPYVWIILAALVLLVITLAMTQLKFLKRYFSSFIH